MTSQNEATEHKTSNAVAIPDQRIVSCGLERGLIIKKPWITRILSNGKKWEMRSKMTNIRGRIGLIEAGSSLVVGEANITGCGNKPISQLERILTAHLHQVPDLDLLDKWCYPWFLEDVKKYEKPIPYNHPQGAITWVRLSR